MSFWKLDASDVIPGLAAIGLAMLLATTNHAEAQEQINYSGDISLEEEMSLPPMDWDLEFGAIPTGTLSEKPEFYLKLVNSLDDLGIAFTCGGISLDECADLDGNGIIDPLPPKTPPVDFEYVWAAGYQTI